MDAKNLKLSVIVAIYGSEKFLSRCLDSVIGQSHKNLEIILVNDCTKDNSIEIAKEYMAKDSRISLVHTEKELWLFKARMFGSTFATGDFITFLDGDDYMGIDGYRLMLNKAIEENADIVGANTLFDNEDSGNKVVRTLSLFDGSSLENEQIIDAFFDNESFVFKYMPLWNKICDINLWKKCKIEFDKIENYYMTNEDYLISMVLCYYCKKFATVEYFLAYYYKNSMSATTPTSFSKRKLLQACHDLPIFFEFAEKFLIENKLHEKYKTKFDSFIFTIYLYHNWLINFSLLKAEEKVECQQLIGKVFENYEIVDHYGSNYKFFETLGCLFDYTDESLRKNILNNHEYISFDIFGTLLKNPFLDNKDLLVILDEKANNLSICNFLYMRQSGETEAIACVNRDVSIYELIDIDIIYNKIHDLYNVEKNILEEIKSIEIDLIFKYTKAGKHIKELFELAKSCGKTVMLTGDTFLKSDTVKKLLKQNNIHGYHKLYLSSELHLSKTIGGLYDYIIKDCGCSASDILHIGDNQVEDYDKARMKNIDAIVYSDSTDLLFNKSNNKYAGNSLALIDNSDVFVNKSMLNRLSLGVISNMYFDNPYRYFSKETDFNADHYYIGLYPLGMHMLGVTKWLIEDSIKKQYKYINFVYGSGNLAKECYDILSNLYENAPESKYVYMDNIAMLSELFNTYEELYCLPAFTNIKNLCPRYFCKKMFNINLDKDIMHLIDPLVYFKDDKFINDVSYIRFLNILKAFDVKLEEKSGSAKSYLDSTQLNNQAIFDMKFSSDLGNILTRFDIKTNGYYIYSENELFLSKHHTISTFYSYVPKSRDGLREYLMSGYPFSYNGYKNNEPQFEPERSNFIDKYVTDTVHKGTRAFVSTMVTTFESLIKDLDVSNSHISLMFEGFLDKGKNRDRSTPFVSCRF